MLSKYPRTISLAILLLIVVCVLISCRVLDLPIAGYNVLRGSVIFSLFAVTWALLKSSKFALPFVLINGIFSYLFWAFHTSKANWLIIDLIFIVTFLGQLAIVATGERSMIKLSEDLEIGDSYDGRSKLIGILCLGLIVASAIASSYQVSTHKLEMPDYVDLQYHNEVQRICKQLKVARELRSQIYSLTPLSEYTENEEPAFDTLTAFNDIKRDRDKLASTLYATDLEYQKVIDRLNDLQVPPKYVENSSTFKNLVRKEAAASNEIAVGLEQTIQGGDLGPLKDALTEADDAEYELVHHNFSEPYPHVDIMAGTYSLREETDTTLWRYVVVVAGPLVFICWFGITGLVVCLPSCVEACLFDRMRYLAFDSEFKEGLAYWLGLGFQLFVTLVVAHYWQVLVVSESTKTQPFDQWPLYVPIWLVCLGSLGFVLFQWIVNGFDLDFEISSVGTALVAIAAMVGFAWPM